MLSNKEYAEKIIKEAEQADARRRREKAEAQARPYLDQPADCQRFEGQRHSGQHRKPELVKNATKCGICQSPADKLENGMNVCQADATHMADGVVGIWGQFSSELGDRMYNPCSKRHGSPM